SHTDLVGDCAWTEARSIKTAANGMNATITCLSLMSPILQKKGPVSRALTKTDKVADEAWRQKRYRNDSCQIRMKPAWISTRPKLVESTALLLGRLPNLAVFVRLRISKRISPLC